MPEKRKFKTCAELGIGPDMTEQNVSDWIIQHFHSLALLLEYEDFIRKFQLRINAAEAALPAGQRSKARIGVYGARVNATGETFQGVGIEYTTPNAPPINLAFILNERDEIIDFMSPDVLPTYDDHKEL